MTDLPRTRSAGQLRLLVMNALWKRGEATAQEVRKILGSRLAPTTVATVLQRLEKSGEVTHRLEGRQYVYRPLVTREQARRNGLKTVLHLLFGGDAASLVAQLVESGDIKSRDLAKVEQLIAHHERQRGQS